MPSKKKSIASKSSRRRRLTKRAAEAPAFTLGLPGERGSSNGTRYEQPLYKKPESKEEREKRLKKREALTLKAFQIAYENHHRRKAS
jgi:hypothetical protein